MVFSMPPMLPPMGGNLEGKGTDSGRCAGERQVPVQAPRAAGGPRLEPADVALGLQYLTGFAVLVVADDVPADALPACVDGAQFAGAHLVILAPIALTTTASAMSIGEVCRAPEWRKRLEDAAREACAVITASGTPFDANEIIPMFDKVPPDTRSSMQKDVAAGNPPELDAIAGPIFRGAEKHGLAVPATQELGEMIRGKSTARSPG